ncbi:MAG: peptide chain release factor N(5)-glutamine methyltransferase [Planctomycetia bacterium]|nr:peptide chain release factor N(5)-glutamine methyltransferase [Planctomycetia bacterium]
MSQQEVWTVRRLLEWTTDFFKSRSSDSPRLEAEVLLAFALKCKRIDLYTSFDDVVSDETKATFRGLVQRRGRGEPVAYLVGHKEFYSLDFKVDSRVLVPRPETEQLVLETIEYVKATSQADPQHEWCLCDIGTGSGNIALTLAKNLPKAVIVATDASSDALDVAQENAQRLGLVGRVEWFCSDLFASIPSDRRFDVIVSNPPYVTRAEYESLAPMVRDFEPKMALLAGESGLDIVDRLARESAAFLVEGGRILIETSPSVIDGAVQAFEKESYWSEIAIINDFASRRRFVSAKKKAAANK